MTDDAPVDDDPDYRGEPDDDDELPELADPTAVPADEGDAGKSAS